MTKYAITGVTGTFGGNAIKELVKLISTNDIVALARNIEKAKTMVPEGVEVRSGDYDNEAELENSLKGIDRLLFVSSQPGGSVPRLTQHQNVVKAAKEAGVSYIAYTSFPHANNSTALLAADHKATEQAIKDSGLKYSFLRNNWYLENEAASLKAADNGDAFVYSAGDGRVGWALEAEYSEAAVKVLVNENAKDIYEFSGASRTYRDLADAISGDFEVKSLSDDEYTKVLKDSGMDDGTIGVVIAIQDSISNGQLDEKTTDLTDVLGHELVPISEAIEKVVAPKSLTK